RARRMKMGRGPMRGTGRRGEAVRAGVTVRRLAPARRRGTAGRTVEGLESRLLFAAGDPFINEFMASNTHTLAVADGSHPDWVELYNPGSSAVNLAGWHLTDNAADPAEWTFPSSNAGLTTVAAGG